MYCSGKTFDCKSCPYKAVYGDKCGIHEKVLPFIFKN